MSKVDRPNPLRRPSPDLCIPRSGPLHIPAGIDEPTGAKNGYSLPAQNNPAFPTASHTLSSRCMRRLHGTSASCFVTRTYPSLSQHPSREKVVRSVVSNGLEWKFIILHLNENGRGGGYKVSPRVVIKSKPDYPFEVIPPGPDIVAEILAHLVRLLSFPWHDTLTNVPQIPRCYEDLDENDWFAVAETSESQRKK